MMDRRQMRDLLWRGRGLLGHILNLPKSGLERETGGLRKGEEKTYDRRKTGRDSGSVVFSMNKQDEKQENGQSN